MKKVLLSVICVLCMCFGVLFAVNAANCQAELDSLNYQISNYYEDSTYPIKNQWHLEESKNRASIAKSDLIKYCTGAALMLFTAVTSGVCVVFVVKRS